MTNEELINIDTSMTHKRVIFHLAYYTEIDLNKFTILPTSIISLYL